MTTAAPRVFSLPAEPGRESEDACALGPGIAVVVDGAGLPAANRRGCSHSVAWYARMLAESFRMALTDAARSMPDALACAIGEVTAAHAQTCDLTKGSPSATVAAWRISGDAVEHLVLADASIVLIGRAGVVREVTDDRVDAAVQARTTELLGDERRSTEEDAQIRFAALDQVRNVDGGFWCAHTDPAAAEHALTGRTLLSDLTGIVAASDGGTRGFQLLGAHTLERFADLASAGQPARIAAEIRAAEDAAPAWDFTKRHDDLTLVVASL